MAVVVLPRLLLAHLRLGLAAAAEQVEKVVVSATAPQAQAVLVAEGQVHLFHQTLILRPQMGPVTLVAVVVADEEP